ncbi:hypothetical protein BH11VER1_BH11VER1_06140 [soil metagenome]
MCDECTSRAGIIFRRPSHPPIPRASQGWHGHYYRNPCRWWAPVAVGATAAFIDGIIPDPVSVDYGMTVIYKVETIYVNNQPTPAA